MTFEERRRHPRVQAYLPLRLHRQGHPHVIETLTKDISLNGIRWISHVTMPIASQCTLELLLPRMSEPLTLKGTVVWFRSLPHAEQFECGISVTELSDPHKRRLSTYILSLA